MINDEVKATTIVNFFDGLVIDARLHYQTFRFKGGSRFHRTAGLRFIAHLVNKVL